MSSLHIAAAATCILSSVVEAQLRTVAVTINPAAPDSISFAPTHPGFHRGLFDVLDIGSATEPGIVSVTAGGVAHRCNPVVRHSSIRGARFRYLAVAAGCQGETGYAAPTRTDSQVHCSRRNVCKSFAVRACRLALFSG